MLPVGHKICSSSRFFDPQGEGTAAYIISLRNIGYRAHQNMNMYKKLQYRQLNQNHRKNNYMSNDYLCQRKYEYKYKYKYNDYAQYVRLTIERRDGAHSLISCLTRMTGAIRRTVAPAVIHLYPGLWVRFWNRFTIRYYPNFFQLSI